MSKITEYPRVTTLNDDDVLLKDGTAGTKTITAKNLADELARKTDISLKQISEYTTVEEITGDDYLLKQSTGQPEKISVTSLSEQIINVALNNAPEKETIDDDDYILSTSTEGATKVMMENLKNELMNPFYGLFGTETTTGSLVEFEAGLTGSVKNAEVEIDPIEQSYNGYSAPWGPGAGKNKLDSNSVTFGADLSVNGGTVTEAVDPTSALTDYILLEAGKAYTISVDSNTTNLTGITAYIFSDQSGASYVSYETSSTTSLTLASAGSDYYVRLEFNSIDALDADIFESWNTMVEEGSERTSYAPYVNICPIETHTECNLYRAGTNLIPNPYVDADKTDISGIEFTIGANGTITLNGVAEALIRFQLSDDNSSIFCKAGTYTLSKTGSGSITLIAVKDGSFWTSASSGDSVVTVADDFDVYFYLAIPKGAEFNNFVLKPQFEYGSESTRFATYRRAEYTEDWSGNVGPIYAGSVNFTAGELTVTHAFIESYAGETLPGEWISSMDLYSAGATPTIGAQVAYELESSEKYSVDIVDVLSLEGNNLMWSDTGDVSVTYRVTLDSAVAAAVPPAIQQIATEEIQEAIQQGIIIAGAGVNKFNNRNGEVMPAAGDYDASMVARGTGTVETALGEVENGIDSANAKISNMETVSDVNAVYVQNSYTTQAAVERISLFKTKSIFGIIRCNLTITTPMPPQTEDVEIGYLPVTMRKDAFLTLASQTGHSTLYVAFNSDSVNNITHIRISNYMPSGSDNCVGFYRTVIPVMLTPDSV